MIVSPRRVTRSLEMASLAVSAVASAKGRTLPTRFLHSPPCCSSTSPPLVLYGRRVCSYTCIPSLIINCISQDTSTSINLMQALKGLSDSGMTVVASIHQPSSQIFALFDSLMVRAQLFCRQSSVSNSPCPALGGRLAHLLRKGS